MTGRRVVLIVASLCVSAALGACAPEVASVRSSGSPAPSVSTTTGGSPGTWLAGLRVERDPGALDDDTSELRDVLGGSLVVSPTSCFRGLPPDVDASAYVLGVVARDRIELDDLVGRTHREPLFEAEVDVLCTD